MLPLWQKDCLLYGGAVVKASVTLILLFKERAVLKSRRDILSRCGQLRLLRVVYLLYTDE